MPAVRRARFVPTAIFLLLATVSLSGCTSAIIGVGTAAVAASTTEKGFSTSVADTQIHAKLTNQFVQSDFSLVTAVDVSVNDGAVLLTGKVKTPEEKILATKLAWEIRGVREVVNELQVTDASSIKDIAKDLAASATLRTKLGAQRSACRKILGNILDRGRIGNLQFIDHFANPANFPCQFCCQYFFFRCFYLAGQ